MRVLLVHNRYRSALPSGENQVVERDETSLREEGAEVRSYVRESDAIPSFGRLEKAALPIRPIHSFADTRAIDRILASWRPDVVHFHNPYPLISPAFIRRAQRAGAAVVQTVHNYRHVCPNGLYFRDGAICRDCTNRRVAWPAIQHGCYRGSRPQSAVMAAALARHRSAFRGVDLFVAVSEFTARFLVDDLGVDPDRVAVRPNSLPDPGPATPPGSGFLCAGRLEPIKGTALLADAWTLAQPAGHGLVIAGDGPDRPRIEDLAARDSSVTYLGAVDRAEVLQQMDACCVVVVPSVGYEAMPMVVVEAFSRGRPVLATGHGAMADLIDREVGWLCEPTPASLAGAIGAAAAGMRPSPASVRRRFESRFSGDEAARWLLDRYHDLLRAWAGTTTGPSPR